MGALRLRSTSEISLGQKEARPYQIKASDRVIDDFYNRPNGISVLSICPSGGKTFTSIMTSERILDQGDQVLILAHGTNVLKNQWIEVLESFGIEYSTDISSSARYIVTLPHSYKRFRSQKNFRLLIVDEAHEFYFAPMVQKILKNIKTDFQLLLTGTPSIFIRSGMLPVIVPGTDVYADGHLTDCYIGMVKSSYSLTDKDYNADDDLKNNHKFDITETEATLDSALQEMMMRLKNNVSKSSPNFSSFLKLTTGNLLNDVPLLFKELEKTMLVAKNIEQATQIQNLLSKRSVNALMSTSDNDTDSELIEVFKKDDSFKVLITVRRGILGFDMPELINVVDFSGSRNIDRIYQLYARVLRKHPNSQKKYFFRISSNLNSTIDSFYTQAAMCLNNSDFISKYNGKNLKSLSVVRPKINEIKKKVRPSGVVKRASSVNPLTVDEELYKDVVGLKLLTELTINSRSKYWQEYEYANFGEIIDKLNGKKISTTTSVVPVKVPKLKPNLNFVTSAELFKKEEKINKTGAQYVNFRISNDNLGLKEDLEAIAKREKITLNDLLNKILTTFRDYNKR